MKKKLLWSIAILFFTLFGLSSSVNAACCTYTCEEQCRDVPSTGPYGGFEEVCETRCYCRATSCPNPALGQTLSTPNSCSGGSGACPSGYQCYVYGPAASACIATYSNTPPPAPSPLPTAIPLPTSVPIGPPPGGPNPTNVVFPTSVVNTCTPGTQNSCGSNGCGPCARRTCNAAGTGYSCNYSAICCPAPTVPPGSTPVPTSPPVPPANGTIQARCKIVPAGATCADIASSSTYATPCTINTAPGLSPVFQTQLNSNYLSWSASPLTYTMQAFGPPGYSLTNACWTSSTGASGTGMAAAVGSNQTVTWDIGFGPAASWSRSEGGDVTVCRNTRSLIPATAEPSPFFLLPGAGGYPGIFTYGGTYDFDSLTGGADFISSTKWRAQDTSTSICTTDWYQYFANKLDVASLSVDYTNPGPLSANNFSPTKEIYRVNGNFSTSGNWNVNNQTLIIFVNGDATINGDINLSGNSFFALIANGNIRVASSVGTNVNASNPNLEGIYITNPASRFYTGASTGVGTAKLIVQGTVIAGGFSLQRDSAPNNATHPGEEFRYDPSILITMPEIFKTVKVNWQEVAP